MRPNRRPEKFAASHQRSWLWGHHAVLETLRAGRWPVLQMFADRQLDSRLLQEIRELTEHCGIRLELVDAGRLQELSHHSDHQGLLARMGEFPCEGPEELHAILEQPSDSATSLPKLFVICDRLQDAHNFGAILRCCDAVRADGVIIGEQNQVAVTPHVARASSGAVNHLRIFRVASLEHLIEEFRRKHVTIVAASEKAAVRHWDTELRGPVAMLIGSEARGLSEELLNRCHKQVAIPMLGGVTSLNAAVAAGILLYECRRQQSYE